MFFICINKLALKIMKKNEMILLSNQYIKNNRPKKICQRVPKTKSIDKTAFLDPL